VKPFSVALFVVSLALAAVAPPAFAQTSSGNAHVADGMTLPRDHQYERYDGTNATYIKVDVKQVPALVRQRVPVYDRTAKAWVFSTKDGLNPQYASTATGDALTADGLALPRGRQYERYDTKNGTYVRVDVNQVPALVRQKVPVYDRTNRAWVYSAKDGINPAYSASSASRQGGWNGDWNRPGGNRNRAESNWARVEGTVTAINGDAVTVREDGGRQVAVNMSEARTRLRGDLKVGDRVSVIGTPTGPDRMTARALRERGAGNDMAGRGQQEDGWQQIHGRVQSVQGTTMTFRADDGRTLTVDLAQVSPQVRQALQQGEGVTVIGHDWTGRNQLRAEYVQQDSSDPSRGGSVAPSASPSSRR
jgi:outer membrane lipoprotein SlyB